VTPEAGHAESGPTRFWPDRSERWPIAGRWALSIGLALLVAGWVLAFSIPGAILIFTGTPVAYAGLTILLLPDRRAWPLLAALAVLIALVVFDAGPRMH
jgi:hypothetical protein